MSKFYSSPRRRFPAFLTFHSGRFSSRSAEAKFRDTAVGRFFRRVNFLEIILIALGLAMDAFAVSIAAGTQGYAKELRPVIRLAFHLGLFQFLMPVIGWYLGTAINQWVERYDHWVAFGLLAFVGSRMIYAGAHPGSESAKAANDPTRRWSLVLVSVATSIDALAIGFSLAMIRVNIWYPSVVIGVVTAGLSMVGLWLGDWVGDKLGRRMEVIGGCILWFIGLRILGEHLFSLG